MDRLTLPCRPKTAEKERCLPAGDGLPAWSTLPLDAKFPMVPNPKGSITLCTTDLCEPKHKVIDFNFDLTDPYCHVISNEYQPLHDPHLRYHFNLPRTQRHLRRNGFITKEGKVICNLKEFNQYRHYLRKIYLLQLARERKEEEEERLRNEKKNDRNVDEKIETRCDQVRKRLLEIREEAKARVEKEILEKAERLRRRLEEIQCKSYTKENIRLQEQRRRQAGIARRNEEIQQRNLMLIRRWKLKEKRHLYRLDELRKLKIFKQQQKSNETWELRKVLQRERMLREEEQTRIENDRRQKSLETRDRMINNQREKLKANLEKLRQEAKQAYEAREENHARRLTMRLALLENQKRHRRNRRGRHYVSLWRLEETLRQLKIPDVYFSGKRSSGQFLQMLNSAMDDAVELVSDVEDACLSDDEVNIRAQEIVQSVIDHVKSDIYPGYVSTREETKAVRFDDGKTVIHSDGIPIPTSKLRPVTDHVVTPVSSPYAIEKQQLSEAKVVGDLIEHLVDDLDNNRLSKEELLKLAQYSAEISNKELEEDNNETGICTVADELVQFTLEKIHNDIKYGNIGHEELTDFTASIISKDFKECVSETSFRSSETEIEQYIDDTIENIMHDGNGMTESPVNESMLDEWIISTLKEIMEDVDKGRLPEEVISQMVSEMSFGMDEDRVEPEKDIMLGPFLERVIKELNRKGNKSLYKVVHAIVSSYHCYKLASTESMSEFTNAVLCKINEQIQAGAAEESEFNVQALSNLATRLSATTLSSNQMHDFTSKIALALEEQDSALSQAANCIVETVLSEALEQLKTAELSQLKKFSDIVTTSLQDLAQVSEKDVGPGDTDEPPYLQNVSKFVVDILKLVWKCLDHNGFTESDIVEMTQLFSNIVQRENISPDNCVSRERLLAKHIEELMELIETGQCAEADLNNLGQSLITCGKRLLGSKDEMSTTSSLTSTVIKDDVVNSLLDSLHDDKKVGPLDKDSIKELALCILRSKPSQETVEIVQGSSSGQRYPSPCDSKMAEDFVRSTIEDIVRDLDSSFIDQSAISSMAVTVVSALSISDSFDHSDQFKSAMEKIVTCLKEDEISRSDAKTIFSVILEQYTSGTFYDSRMQDVFPESQATTSDSFLAESLIRETLSKIERDIASGQLSNEDLLSVVESSRDNALAKFKVSGDVVNFSLAVLQQFVFDLNIGKISLKSLAPFLQVLDDDCDSFGVNKMSIAEVREKIQRIMSDIRHKKTKSKYIKNIVKGFSRKEMRASKKTSPVEKDPITALHHILENIHSDILSNFIRATLSNVLNDLCKKEGKQTETISDFELQTASSTVANKVVQNLLQRIENTVLTGDSLTSDVELDDSMQDESSGLTVSRLTSQEVSCMILDTLNNIVSNLRLERSMSHDGILASEVNTLQGHVSSHLIHDFILEKLQGIVENMQEQITFDGKEINSKTDKDVGSVDDSKTVRFISESLKNVVSDMALETTERTRSGLNETTSTSSLEAEAVVIETLHNIIAECDADGQEVNKESTEMKNNLILAMEGIRRNFKEYNSLEVCKAITNLFRSRIPELQHVGSKSDDELDNYIKSTIELIIENIKNDNIKSENVFPNTPQTGLVSNGDSILAVGELTDASISNVSTVGDPQERPCLNLQKMTEMTSEMLKLQEDLGDTFVKSEDQETASEHSLINQIATGVSDIATEVVHKTITNIKDEQLSKSEMLALATVISESNQYQEISDSDLTEIRATESGMQEYIISILEKVSKELETNGVDTYTLHSVTSRIAQFSSSKDTQDGEVSPVSSEIIVGLVNKVLSKIVSNISDDDSNVLHTDNVELSESTQSQTSGDGSISKHNVNPNASSKRWSARSARDSVGPLLKNAPVAKIHSAHKIATNVISDRTLTTSPEKELHTDLSMKNRSLKIFSKSEVLKKSDLTGILKQELTEIGKGEKPKSSLETDIQCKTRPRKESPNSPKVLQKTPNCNVRQLNQSKFKRSPRTIVTTPPPTTPAVSKISGSPNLKSILPKPPTSRKIKHQVKHTNVDVNSNVQRSQHLVSNEKKIADRRQRETSAHKTKKTKRTKSASKTETKTFHRKDRKEDPELIKSLCGSHKLLVKVSTKATK